MSLILRSEFSSYSSVNGANVLKCWVSRWFIVSWESKAVQNFFFLPVGSWKDTTSVNKFRETICKTEVQLKKIAISNK